MNKLTEGKVDVSEEHFELTYGSVQVDKPTFVKVVLLGKISDNEFAYEFLGEHSDEIKKHVLHSLEFYLIEHGPTSVFEDAWKYAKYHATTSSNIYSLVHWNFYPVNVTTK